MDSGTPDLRHLGMEDRHLLMSYMNPSSRMMQRVLSELVRYAPSDLPIVVEGESGTGKEMFVWALHSLSRRSAGPLVAVSMGEGPETLFESALFGHRRGAFTGAEQSREGYFEQANGGTLYLDEINSLGLSLQPKLLRVLETRTYRPIGSMRIEQTTARFVFSSNESLERMTVSGKLRIDLFYRMGHIVRLPSLRERKEDIPDLTRSLLSRAMKSIILPSGRTEAKIESGALDRLQSYNWPGNIRQLRQVLERALLLSVDGRILPEHLDLPYEEESVPNWEEALEEMEESYFTQIFRIAGPSIKKGIELTGMSETSYRRKVRKYGRRNREDRFTGGIPD